MIQYSESEVRIIRGNPTRAREHYAAETGGFR